MEILQCLLLPIQNRTLMVPYNAVVEVISLQDPQKIFSSSNWILGDYIWRGLSIPLISLESINQIQETAKISESVNIAILNRVSEQSPDFMGIVLQALPKMEYFMKSDITWVSQCKEPFLVMEILAKNKTAFILNISWIEETVVKQMSHAKS